MVPQIFDLTSPDFFLWGFIKNVVYAEVPTTRDNMIDRIRKCCNSIPRNSPFGNCSKFRMSNSIMYSEWRKNFRTLIAIENSQNLALTGRMFSDLALSDWITDRFCLDWLDHPLTFLRTQKKCKSDRTTSAWYILGSANTGSTVTFKPHNWESTLWKIAL